MNTHFKIGIAQISPRLGDVAANLALYEQAIAHAKNENVELLIFPELSLTGYHLRDMVATVALRQDAPEFIQLRELSKSVACLAGLVEESPDFCFYNSAVYLSAGDVRHVHRKVYLPTYGMFDEQRYFARGDSVRAFDTPYGRAAALVCEDMWHPSTVYIAALDRALMLICPSSSPLRGIADKRQQDENARYWEAMNRVYAETFGVFVIYANRVGFEDGVGFWGGSEVINPFGQCIAKGRYYEEDFVTADISLDAVRRKRVAAPLLRDEDIDLTINELLRIRGRRQ
ncbi:MAG: hypothetical protein OXC18_09410 [Desulfurellaceae bacterium]|nr:hypothetical protein [Desulfurellaceae bacterium]